MQRRPRALVERAAMDEKALLAPRVEEILRQQIRLCVQMNGISRTLAAIRTQAVEVLEKECRDLVSGHASDGVLTLPKLEVSRQMACSMQDAEAYLRMAGMGIGGNRAIGVEQFAPEEHPQIANIPWSDEQRRDTSVRSPSSATSSAASKV